MKRILVFIAMLVMGCTPASEELSDLIAHAETVDEAAMYAEVAAMMGEEGVPILMSAAENIDVGSLRLLDVGKTNAVLYQLLVLAEEGYYQVDEVPLLVRVVGEQRYMGDTLVPARILLIITNVDVGYDEDFVRNYHEGREAERQEMLAIWSAWYERRQQLVN